MNTTLHPAALIRARPLGAYVALACLITWLPALPGVFGFAVSDMWGQAPRSAWYSFGALGPLIGAGVVVGLYQGRDGLKQMLGRLGHWRVGSLWALIGLGTPALFLGIAVLLAWMLGHTWTDLGATDLAARDWDYWVLVALLPALFYAISEEIGWRGFALDHLQRHFSAFTATALVAALWAFWHLPFYILQTNISPAQFIGLLTSLFAEAVFLTFLYNGSRGSLLLVVWWHLNWSALSLIVALVSTSLATVMSAVLMLFATGALFAIETHNRDAVRR